MNECKTLIVNAILDVVDVQRYDKPRIKPRMLLRSPFTIFILPFFFSKQVVLIVEKVGSVLSVSCSSSHTSHSFSEIQ